MSIVRRERALLVQQLTISIEAKYVLKGKSVHSVINDIAKFFTLGNLLFAKFWEKTKSSLFPAITSSKVSH